MEAKITPLGWLSTIVTLLFVTLKLTDEIDWSWWLVFLPTLIHFGVWLGLLALVKLLLWAARPKRRVR